MPMSLFTCYSLEIQFVPFLKKWPATIPCKIDDKVGKKTAIKEERKRKKRERQIRNLKKSNFWLVRMRENTKAV